MNIDTSTLDEFRTPAKARTRAKNEWRPPALDDFAEGQVIAFDPSLNGCAVVQLLGSPKYGLHVITAHSFKMPEVSADGHEASLRKALLLENLITQWIYRNTYMTGIPYVHELPPVGGGKMMRPESALMASQAIRTVMAKHEARMLPMIGKQKHAKFVCGNGNAKKPVHHAVLAELAESLPIKNYKEITNEGKRDALSVALYALAKEMS